MTMDNTEPASGIAELKALAPVARTFGSTASVLASRPTTLDGLRIGLLWNGKPNGDVALRETARVITDEFPTAETILYEGRIACERSLLESIADECDVVIACTADCGSCTSWITHDCIQLERLGVPTVIIASAGFVDNVDASSEAFGMPRVQYVVVPLVFNNIGTSEAIQQTTPVVPEIVRTLTSGVPGIATGADPGGGDPLEVAYAYVGGIDGLAQLNRDFLDRDWGDGYPLWPPTQDKVAELIEATGREPDDAVCVLPPGNGYATVAAIAVNAAMAGCRPQEMPVLLAALRAIANLRMPMGRMGLMSTSAQAPLFLINGPIADELGINGGRGCLGPGKQNEVNIRLGRAAILALKNIGRWYPGVMDMDTLGSPRKFSMLLAENERESPWEPYHVTRGFDRDENVVSLFMTSGEWDVGFQGHMDAQQLARAIAAKACGAVQSTYLHNFMVENTEDGRLILMAPQHAEPLHQGGFSKQGYIEFLHEHVREPVARMIEPLWKLHTEGRTKPEWGWLFELAPDDAATTFLPALDRPELWNIVVAGSVRAKDLVLPLMCLPVSEPV